MALAHGCAHVFAPTLGRRWLAFALALALPSLSSADEDDPKLDDVRTERSAADAVLPVSSIVPSDREDTDGSVRVFLRSPVHSVRLAVLAEKAKTETEWKVFASFPFLIFPYPGEKVIRPEKWNLVCGAPCGYHLPQLATVRVEGDGGDDVPASRAFNLPAGARSVTLDVVPDSEMRRILGAISMIGAGLALVAGVALSGGGGPFHADYLPFGIGFAVASVAMGGGIALYVSGRTQVSIADAH